MVSQTSFRKLAGAFAEAEEAPHFDKASFRVRKKIFTTLDTEYNRACVKLNESDQAAFSGIDAAMIYPVPGAWGRQGWTFVELKKVNTKILKALLTAGYCNVAPKRLAVLYEE
jgi:hypothetical protein